MEYFEALPPAGPPEPAAEHVAVWGGLDLLLLLRLIGEGRSGEGAPCAGARVVPRGLVLDGT